ncbi:MAG: SBBP repeat-containing protein [Terriglobia bacterium]
MANHVKAPETGQPKLGQKVRHFQSYGRLPLSFEANQGQTDGRVRFLARGGGYTIFLTDDEAVLTLRKSQPSRPGMTRLGQLDKFGLPGHLHPIDSRARLWPSLADDLKSLRQSLIPELSQLVSEPNAGQGAVAAGPESQSAQAVRMRLVGGNFKAHVVGQDELPGRSNYFIGNDPKKWRTNVPNYTKVKYEGVYPGVDLVYYGDSLKDGRLEYDFVVQPGADPNQIKLSFAGADGICVDAASGDLVLTMGHDEVRLHKPAVYQPTVAAVSSPPTNLVAAVYDRRRRSQSAATAEPDGAFVLVSNYELAFRVAGYDPKRVLVIDPVLSYSTYLGGSNYDSGFSVAVDVAGNAYVTGITDSTDFPTANPLQSNNGGPDAFVAKLNPAGSVLAYSTYVGGSGLNVGAAIAVDSAGNAYVTGWTDSTDFPTANPFQPHLGGSDDGFVTKLNSAGSALVYSTYLGGSASDGSYGIAVDAAGNAYVTGGTYSTDFPTANPLYSCSGGGAFVTKFNPTGSALVYSTCLGGSGDEGNDIAVDAAGNAYVTGATGPGFPTLNPLQSSYHGGGDLFVAKLNPTGSALVYSTYLGGSSYDEGDGIAVDAAGNAYVTGYTTSTDFPTANPFQANCGACNPSLDVGDAFVAKLNPNGSALVYSTYLGGSNANYGRGIAADAAGNAYLGGSTDSPDFPTANPLQGTCGGDNPTLGDAFVAKLNPAGSVLVYSTCLGGSSTDGGGAIAVDAAGNAYVTGLTYSPDFPTANPLQPGNKGDGDAFVAKIAPVNAPGLSLSSRTLVFGPYWLRSTSPPMTLILKDVGSAPLAITAITTSASFAQTNTCRNSVPVGSNCTISVIFTPGEVGPIDGTLTINDNASNASNPQTVDLAGVGDAVAFLPSSLSFGTRVIGVTNSGQVVSLTNKGNTALTITSIGIRGGNAADFSQNNDCPLSPSALAVGGTCSITAKFAPTAPGPRKSAVSISDPGGSSPQVALLTGVGSAASIAPATLTFSSQIMGTSSAPQTVTLTNKGAVTMRLFQIAISGTNAGDFSKTTTCAGTLGAGASCKVSVAFKPTAAGARTASVLFSDDAGGSPQSVAVSGAGVASSVRPQRYKSL